jgi:hypothetical protein
VVQVSPDLDRRDRAGTADCCDHGVQTHHEEVQVLL